MRRAKNAQDGRMGNCNAQRMQWQRSRSGATGMPIFAAWNILG